MIIPRFFIKPSLSFFSFLYFCNSTIEMQNEPEGTPDLPAANRTLFLEKVRAHFIANVIESGIGRLNDVHFQVRQSNAACQSGDFTTAVALYTDALALDPTNHILYSNRSAARLKQGQFQLALQVREHLLF